MKRVASIRWLVVCCLAGAPAASVAQSLSCGQNHVDQITAAGQEDVLIFQGSAGDCISLVLWQTGGSNFTAHGDLYAPSSTSVPILQGLNGEVPLNLAESGTYILRVHASNLVSTGSYVLELNWLTPQPCNVIPIQCGQDVAATIADRAEQHFYSFDAQAGDTISLVLWQTGGSNFTAHGELYGPTSGCAAMLVDLNGETQIDLPETGQYTLRVHASSFYYTGTYALEFNTLAPIARQCGVTPIVCGGNVSATIAARAEQHFYSFDAQAGDTISLVLWQTGGSNFTAQGDLYGPSSLPTALHVDLNGETQIDLLETGQYTLRVHASSFYYTGTYALEFNILAPVPQQCDVTPIGCGDHIAAAITARAEQHFYSFDAQAGDTISLVLWQTGGSNFTAHAELYDPGAARAQTSDLNGVNQVTLGQSGTHTLVVHASSHYYTGTYALDLTWIAPFSQQCYDFVRGDASLDQTTNLLDVILTLNYLFLNESRPCLEALDANDDAAVNLVDPIYTLNYLFAGGGPPSPPFPMCGLDPAPLTSLGCSPMACP